MLVSGQKRPFRSPRGEGMTKLRVTVHDFETNPRNIHARDGSNLAYSEVTRLLQSADGADIQLGIHDFIKLCADETYAHQVLSNCDCVVSNVGPHAYIYFYLRDKFGLDFRIIRDVRTALWNSYLFQELMVARYVRPQDTVIHLSAYSRDLFLKLFPHMSQRSTFVCYPLLRWFPERTAAKHPRRTKSASLERTIGFVGRLTDDKNFAQALDLIIELHRRAPGRFRLRAIGQDLSPKYSLSAVNRRLKVELGTTDVYEWVSPVLHHKIWGEYEQLDVLFFPSTSNLETFGRVLIEAIYWGVPILASSHAAACELLGEESLLTTRYLTDQDIDTHLAHPLGVVDVDEAATRLIEGYESSPGDKYTRYGEHDKLFLSIVLHGNEWNGNIGVPVATEIQTHFVNSISMYDLALSESKEQADDMCARMREILLRLHDFGSARYYLTLLRLYAVSRYRRKTAFFIRRSLKIREDLTNIGGIDLQMTHFLKLYPYFRISG